MNSHLKQLPKDNEVAKFMHLHLNTAEPKSKHPHRQGHWIIEVEGKARPMLVIRALPNKERGRKWFLTLPITSKGTDESGKPRNNDQRMGNCLEASKDSYIVWELHKYPENLLQCGDEGSPLVTPCDELAFRTFLSLVRHKVERGQLHLLR